MKDSSTKLGQQHIAVAVLAAAATGAVLFRFIYKKFQSTKKDTNQSPKPDIPASCLDKLTFGVSKDSIRSMRRENFCAGQSVSYDNTEPLLIVRGDGQYLYDEKGTAYLDTRNNVGHLGHTHPAVVKAVQVLLFICTFHHKF